MTKPPLIDVSSINAVQSLLSKVPRDPWARRLTAEFADFIIYNETARYAFVRPSAEQESASSASFPQSNSFARVPELLRCLMRHSPHALEEETYFIEDGETVAPDILPEVLEALLKYSLDPVHRKNLHAFVRLHNDASIKNDENAIMRRREGPAFPIRQIKRLPLFAWTAASSGLGDDDVNHLVEMLLKYPLYGGMAGTSTYYLAHPLRLEIGLPGILKHPAVAPHLPLPLGEYFAKVAPQLNSDSFAKLLIAAREVVRDLGVNTLSRQEADENRNELYGRIFDRLRLKARIKHLETVAAVIQGSCVAIALNHPGLREVATGVGTGISMTKAWWNRPLSPIFAGRSWLHWCVVYGIEDDGQ